MARFTRSYTVPSPYSAANAIPVALKAVKDLFAGDLSWALEFDNSDTNTTANTNAPYMNGARLYTTAAATTIIAQVVVKSPCNRWRLMFFWSTTSANNGLACVARRVNDPTTEAASITAAFTNSSSYSELTAGVSTLLIVDTFGFNFNIQKRHKTAAGVITNSAVFWYQYSLIKNAAGIPDASALGFYTASTNSVQIPTGSLSISIDGMANEMSNPNLTFIADPISTTPAYAIMPYEFISVPAIVNNAPVYSLSGWIYAYINKPDIASSPVIEINGRKFVWYVSTSTRQYFEIDDYLPADLQ